MGGDSLCLLSFSSFLSFHLMPFWPFPSLLAPSPQIFQRKYMNMPTSYNTKQHGSMTIITVSMYWIFTLSQALLQVCSCINAFNSQSDLKWKCKRKTECIVWSHLCFLKMHMYNIHVNTTKNFWKDTCKTITSYYLCGGKWKKKEKSWLRKDKEGGL